MRRFLCIGHPRCGSGSMSKLLTEKGYKVGHEVMKSDGVSSWMMAVEAEKYPFGPITLKGKGKESREMGQYYFEKIIHYVRNPDSSIPSIILENRCTPNNTSYNFKRKHIKDKLGINLPEYKNLSFQQEVELAVSTFIYWNKICEMRNPDIVFRVDVPEDLLKLEGKLVSETPVANVNKTYNGKRYEKPNISEEHYDALPQILKDELEKFREKYGYYRSNNINMNPTQLAHLNRLKVAHTVTKAVAPKVEPKVVPVKVEPKVELKAEPKVAPVKVEPKVAPLKAEPKVEPVKAELKVAPVKAAEPKVEPVKSEPKVAPVKLAPKVPVKVEPKVALKVEPKVALKVEPVKVELKAELKVEPVKAELKVEPVKAELKAEPKVALKSEPKVALKAEPKVALKVAPVKLAPKVPVKVELKVEPVKAAPKVALKSEPKVAPVKVEPKVVRPVAHKHIPNATKPVIPKHARKTDLKKSLQSVEK